MLARLSIRDIVLIDKLDLDFAKGLAVLTGETGAGKSILVGAVGLLVGGRASADLVRTGEDTAAVQAVFEAPDGREVIVRREVSAQGRSRGFVDGALCAGRNAINCIGIMSADDEARGRNETRCQPANHRFFVVVRVQNVRFPLTQD